MKAIVAVDEKWGIGKNNDLLFSIPEDMKFFRQTTLNKVVVMGSNTLKSFPNGTPLKNRVNVVLSTTVNRDDCIVTRSLEELKEKIKGFNQNDVFLIGGAKLYGTMIDYCDEAYITKVKSDGKAQVFFPNLDQKDGWEMVSETEEKTSGELKFTFTTYKNTKVKNL